MADSAHTTNASGKKVRGKRAPNGAPVQFIKDHLQSNQVDCILWPFAIDPYGYGVVGCPKSKLPSNRAHRLMCIWAHGAPSLGKNDAAHSCGNRRCVNPNHIRWATVLENNRERWAHGTMPVGETNPASKLSLAQVAEILASDRSGPELAADFGVTRSTINKVRRRETWTYKTNG